MVTSALAALALLSSPAPSRADTLKQWQAARFGMFIHWGVYSEAAGNWNGKEVGGAGEWLLSNAQIKPDDYEPLAKKFNPTKYDPAKWVRLAKVAGMSTSVLCACPQHVAELILQLASFEAYCHSCLSRNANDAHLHAFLASVSGSARALFERALEKVAEHEGIKLGKA